MTTTIDLDLDAIRLDGGTQIRAAVDLATIGDYAKAMVGGAVLPPVVVFNDGTDYWLADGFHRVAAAKEAERTVIAATVELGTKRDAILFAAGANAAHGLRRTPADKRRAVELLLLDPEWVTWADRAIARAAGVGRDLVDSVRRELELSGRIRQIDERTVERGGATFTMARAERPAAEPAQDGADIPWDAIAGDDEPADSTTAERPFVSAMTDAMRTAPKPAAPPPIPAVEDQAPEKAPVRNGDEWYTPADLVALARETLGTIHFDPASCAVANETVGAQHYYSLEKGQDGLALHWNYRTLFMNPPYSDTEAWIDRLIDQHVNKRCFPGGAWILVLAKTDTGWFDRLWTHASLCLLRGRVKHVAGDGGAEATGRCGSAVFYLGPDHENFARVHAHRGRVLPPMPWSADAAPLEMEIA